MNKADVVMFSILLIYNISTFRLLAFALRQIDVRNAVQEKSPEARSLASTNIQSGSPPQDTSYSRVSGMIGAVVIATFFWSIGNVILYKAFVSPVDDIKELISSLATFLFGGASLFLPYAFNQLREVFGSSR